ncbi:hypothetical protein S40293_01614, partial [Stachybotrys chartarum IBT 40293]
MGSALSQAWPPAPRFTEKDVPDQHGKVFIVTGGSSGVGKALTKILYSLNAKIYIANRPGAKIESAISEIRDTVSTSTGELVFLPINLDDLNSVRKAAEEFTRKEKRLDMLWNNAGVMLPPAGSVSEQGYELQLGVNCLAALLFTRLLTPVMKRTAERAEKGSVRVLWVSSSAAELFSPAGGGVKLDNLDYHMPVSETVKYAISKAGMVLLSHEYAERHRGDGIVSVVRPCLQWVEDVQLMAQSMNPGNLKSDLGRSMPGLTTAIFRRISWNPVYGAYTELFSAFSPEITLDNSGCWVIPWGRISPVRQDIADAGVRRAENEAALSQQFWDWCEEELKGYGIHQ